MVFKKIKNILMYIYVGTNNNKNWKQAQYVMVLCSFKEQLQQHVRVHAVEAVMACREIENNLHSLAGFFSPTFSIYSCKISRNFNKLFSKNKNFKKFFDQFSLFETYLFIYEGISWILRIRLLNIISLL